MDLNYILLWVLGIYWVSFLWSLARHGLPVDRGFLLLASVCLSAFVVALAFLPGWAGILGAVPWALFMVLPGRLASWRNGLIARQRHTAARRLTRLIRLLHPTAAARDAEIVSKAHDLARLGRSQEALVLIERLSTTDSPAGWTARLEVMGLERRWEEMRAYVDGHPRRSALLSDPTCIVFLLRSLGETGNVDRMAYAYREHAGTLRRGPDVARRHAQLFVAALGGRHAATDGILLVALASLGPEIKAFWRATAAQAAGMPDIAAPLLVVLAGSAEPPVRDGSRRRLNHPLPPARPGPEAASILDRLEREVVFAVSRPPAAVPPGHLSTATGIVMGLLGAAFLLEIPGGSTNLDNLYRLGAMVAPLSHIQGQWWRAVTAAFLHYGPLHLGMNLLALSLFGRHLERLAGPGRFLATFLLAGPGSMLATAIAWTIVPSQLQVIVGASGGVMGCLGATASTLLIRRVRRHIPPGERQLRDIAMAVGIQVAFDLSTPQVSFVAHASGLTIGFLLGGALELVRPRP